MTEPNPFLALREGACELWLIRHGDASPEADGVIAPHYDEQPLSRLGRSQAEALAARLSAVRFAALYTSPLIRCLQTAAPLLARTDLPLTHVADLQEIRHNGDVQPRDGMARADFVAAFVETGNRIGAHALRTGSFDGVPGAEPRAQFRGRVRAAVDGIAARHPSGRVAVFAHGGVINVYAADVLGLDRDFFVPLANTAVSVVRVLGARRILVSLNDLCHLRNA